MRREWKASLRASGKVSSVSSLNPPAGPSTWSVWPLTASEGKPPRLFLE